MALYVKASPSVIFLGLRAVAIGSSTSIKGTMNYAFRRQQSQSPNFSSVAVAESPDISSDVIAAKDLVDSNFAKVLKNEINSTKSNLKVSQVKTPTDTFPFKFEFYSRIYRGYFSRFERKFPDGEEVIVTVYESVSNDDDDDDHHHKGDKVKDESKNDMKTPPAIPMHVFLTTQRRNRITFDIIVSEEDIIIESYFIFGFGSGSGSGSGAKIQDLDHHLERSLSKYLEKKGIKSIASFLIHNKRVCEEAKEIELLSFMEYLERHLQK